MFRYFAYFWDPDNLSHAAVVHGLRERIARSSENWQCVLERRNVRVFCTGIRIGSNEPYLLHDQLGVVLGALFIAPPNRASANPRAVLGIEESERIVASCGRSLVTSYWGRYVAIICDAQNTSVHVLRDPTGGLSCLNAVTRGV